MTERGLLNQRRPTEQEWIVCSGFALPANCRETEMVSWKDMAFLAAMLILCAMPLAFVLVFF
jgi:hypothetical protein